jgi:hypothetical protein
MMLKQLNYFLKLAQTEEQQRIFIIFIYFSLTLPLSYSSLSIKVLSTQARKQCMLVFYEDRESGWSELLDLNQTWTNLS